MRRPLVLLRAAAATTTTRSPRVRPPGRRPASSAAVGFALDGFPIAGPRGDGGKVLSNAKLDACHGHTGWVVVRGKRVRTYHYHATLEYPYTLGCFRGTPPRLQSDLVPGGPGGGPGAPPSTSPPPTN